MRDRAVVTFVLFCCLLLASAAPVFAQAAGAGVVAGVVTTSGQPLPGVTVTVTGPNLAGPRSTSSSGNGDYVFPALPPGEYRLTFELQGYRSQTIGPVTVTIDRSASVNADLQPGATSEEIIVTSSIEIIDTNNLVVKSDTATQVNFLGPIASPPNFIINTANLASDSVISERASRAMLGIDVPIVKSDRFRLRTGAAIGYGTQDVTIKRNTGSATQYSGNAYSGMANSSLRIIMAMDRALELRAGYSQSRGDVTRDPASASTGVVTEKHDIRVTRLEFGSTFSYTVGRTTYIVGAENYNFWYSIFHEIDIDFSNTIPGARSEIDGETKLKKSGVRAKVGLEFAVNPNIDFLFLTAVGPDGWAGSLGVNWTLR